MPFPLEDFASFIDPKIRDRGYRYFMDGRIENLEETKQGEWRAEVQGSELYQVILQINEEVVVGMHCSCPYDYGPVCKHEVALCYSLRMKLLNTEPDHEVHETGEPIKSIKKPGSKKTGRKTVAKQIEEKMEQLQQGQIRGFLQEILEDDRYHRSVFMARFTTSELPQTKADYRKQVQRMLQPAKSRRNMVGWGEAHKYLDGIGELLSGVEQQLIKGDYSTPITACQVIIEELVPAFQYIDDSGGDVGYLVERSFELLNETAGRTLDESTQTAFMEDCLHQFGDERYEGWDFGGRFLDLAIRLAEAPEAYNKIEGILIKEFERAKNEADLDFIYSYKRERHAARLLDLYQTSGRKEQSLMFMKENRDLSNIMERLIEYSWKQNDYSRVAAYSKEALQQFTSKPGLNSQWLKWQLKVAEAKDDIKGQRQITEKLLLDTSKMEWYKQLKRLYDKTEWSQKVDELLNTYGNGKWVYSGLVPSICIEEKRWDELFEYVKGNPSLPTLQQYDSWLKNHYLDELLELYKDRLLEYMEKNTGRKYYKEACAILKRMKALGGTRKAGEVIEILETEYANRPALQDELSKAGLVN